MNPDDRGAEPSASSGRAAVVISQTYYYAVAAIGLAFLLGGTIAALIALRKWVLPVGADASEFFGGPADRNDAPRSFLGALAFAIPGALAFAWHLREGRRREGRAFRASWGGVLYFHLVAFIAVLITMGGVVALLHSLRDAAVPFCYDVPGFDDPVIDIPSVAPGAEGLSPIPPIELPEDVDAGVLFSDEECYPSTAEALRSAIDAGIVAVVAGLTWLWHLRRGRRSLEEPPRQG